MFSGLKLCFMPARNGASGEAMFPEILNDIPQEIYCRRYAPLWALSMSRPLSHAQYKTATDVSEFSAEQVTCPCFVRKNTEFHFV
jgi:hypothetical protein